MRRRLRMDSGLISPMDGFLAELKAARSAGVSDVVDASLVALKQASHSRTQDRAVLFNHPVRVASLLLKYESQYSADLIALAVLHNTFEKGLFSEIELASIANDKVASGVAFLSTIRGAAKITEIRDFYSEVGKQDGGMSAKVKVADKLDNLYMLCFNPDATVRETYIEEIQTFVLPLAEKYLPRAFGEISAACQSQRVLGFLDKNKELITARRLFDEN